jgi:hypothetical protein
VLLSSTQFILNIVISFLSSSIHNILQIAFKKLLLTVNFNTFQLRLNIIIELSILRMIGLYSCGCIDRADHTVESCRCLCWLNDLPFLIFFMNTTYAQFILYVLKPFFFKMLYFNLVYTNYSTYPALVKSLVDIFNNSSTNTNQSDFDTSTKTVPTTNAVTTSAEYTKRPIREFLMSWNRRIAESKIFFTLMEENGFTCIHHGHCIYSFTRSWK